VSHCCDGQAKVMYKRIIGSRSANHWGNFHRFSINFCRGINNYFDKWVVWIGAGGRFASPIMYFNIIKTLLIEMGAEFFEDVVRFLIWNEAKIHLCRCTRRLYGFLPYSLVSAC
jgi:hypothetical protein